MNLNSVLNPTPSFAALPVTTSTSFSESRNSFPSISASASGTSLTDVSFTMSADTGADVNLLTALVREHDLDEGAKGMLSTFQMSCASSMTFSESVPPLMSFALGLELRSRVNQLSDAVTSLEAELEKLAIQQQPFVVTKELSIAMLSIAKDQLVAEVYTNVNDLWQVVLVRIESNATVYGVTHALANPAHRKKIVSAAKTAANKAKEYVRRLIFLSRLPMPAGQGLAQFAAILLASCAEKATNRVATPPFIGRCALMRSLVPVSSANDEHDIDPAMDIENMPDGPGLPSASVSRGGRKRKTQPAANYTGYWASFDELMSSMSELHDRDRETYNQRISDIINVDNAIYAPNVASTSTVGARTTHPGNASAVPASSANQLHNYLGNVLNSINSA
ncbi:hypothetical protein BC629DRAFT_1460423 [Irpex lacteus]|nr:hypothetical protein BC629DRAFT_1460423 [Irpex lacteus]